MTTQVVNGWFKNVASTPYFVKIPNYVNRFDVWNLTVSGVTSQGVTGLLASDRISRATIIQSVMTNGTALIEQNGTIAGILAPKNNGIAAINGLTIFNAALPVNGPNIVINSFTPGTTTVFVTNTAHGFKVGDVVRIGNMTSAPQLGGLSMTVTAVGSTTQFTTLLNSSLALTSVGVVYKVYGAGMPSQSLYYPEFRAIASITLANPMVVKLLVQQDYQIGDVVTFQIPTAYGMQNLNVPNTGLPFEATVSAVNNAVGTQTVTFANVDSTAFTAFAYAAAASYPYGRAVMIPRGAGNTNNLLGVTPTPLPYANQDILGFARQNQGYNGVVVGAGDGTNSATTGGIIGANVDAWYWEAVTVSQTF